MCPSACARRTRTLGIPYRIKHSATGRSTPFRHKTQVIVQQAHNNHISPSVCCVLADASVTLTKLALLCNCALTRVLLPPLRSGNSLGQACCVLSRNVHHTRPPSALSKKTSAQKRAYFSLDTNRNISRTKQKRLSFFI